MRRRSAVDPLSESSFFVCGAGRIRSLATRDQRRASKNACSELSQSSPFAGGFVDGREQSTRFPARFLKLQPAFRALYLRRMNNPAALAAAWHQLPTVLQHRYSNAQGYDELLQERQWQLLSQWQAEWPLLALLTAGEFSGQACGVQRGGAARWFSCFQSVLAGERLLPSLRSLSERRSICPAHRQPVGRQQCRPAVGTQLRPERTHKCTPISVLTPLHW